MKMCKGKTFEEVKAEYEKAREIQRIELIKYLKLTEKYVSKSGCKLSARGGKGEIKGDGVDSNIHEYCLSNWKWVEAISIKNNVYYFISFQPYDGDFNRYHHAIFDRIGIYVGRYINELDPCSKKSVKI